MEKNRTRRSYLIAPRFQFRYTLLVIAITVVVYGALGHLYYREMATRATINEKLVQVDLALSRSSAPPEIRGVLKNVILFEKEDRSATALGLFLGLFVMVAVLLAIGLYLTHRIAGPVHAVCLHLDNLARGKLSRMRPFRRGDEFTGLASHLEGLRAALVVNEEQERAQLVAIRDALDQGAPAGALSQTLGDLIKRKDERIDG